MYDFLVLSKIPLLIFFYNVIHDDLLIDALATTCRLFATFDLHSRMFFSDDDDAYEVL